MPTSPGDLMSVLLLIVVAGCLRATLSPSSGGADLVLDGAT
jgi:hypothetical protein